ncbi:MAG: 4-hydroxy-tetrahydrodipicolinate synthase [Chlamydiales bacterium]|jgi:4-hydroxy-tetrahydrodipicolinate synthase|nr:4-hydroxy-tetrahydrodipicolinate synthase [Chlamydiales bacterium]
MFKGSIVALITPFDTNNQIDEIAFSNLIEWHIAEETSAIVVCGTTGESVTLSIEEKIRLFRLAVEVAGKRIPIIAGTGTNNTLDTIYLTTLAKQAGVEACLVVTPYYNRPTAAGCIAHYQAVAAIGLPVIVYHVAARTGCRMCTDTIAKIAQIPNIVALKEANCDIAAMMDIREQTKIALLSGDDHLLLPALSIGACGIISVTANLIPKIWAQLINNYQQGHIQEAVESIYYYRNLCKSLFIETNPVGVKYALSLMNKCKPHVRLPLVELQQDTKAQVSNNMRITGVIT